MSPGTQAIFFFIAFLGCLLAAFGDIYRDSARRTFLWFHTGWFGLACFCFVFFWIAVKAS